MKHKIFISSVQTEFKRERPSIYEWIMQDSLLKEYFKVVLFEKFPAKSASAKKAYLEEVRNCDIFLLILGNEYGSIIKETKSAIEIEFHQAIKFYKHILIYIRGNEDNRRHARVRALIKEIENPERGYIYRRFTSAPELKNYIYESLIDYLREKGIVGKTVFDQRACEGASLDDVNEGKLEWFLRTAQISRRFALDPGTPAKDAFVHLNLLTSDKLTNAAVLLFGKNPKKFHAQAEVKCIQFPGTEIQQPFSSYHIYTYNLFEQIDKAMAFVLDSIRLPMIPRERMSRVQRFPEIPDFVIREAIVNAVAHRDYNNTGAVQVMIFIDRVEVWNPGGLPPQLTIEALKKPHTSYPNNPLLAEVLYLANYIQKAGSGTLKMIQECRSNGLPEPEFLSILGKEFHVIIPRDIYSESMLLKLGLNERQLKAVKYVKEKGKITNRDYQNLTGISKPMATIDLRHLVEKGVLIKKGISGRGTEYILGKG